MPKALFFLLFSLISPFCFAQTNLYLENFTGQNAFGAIGQSSGIPIISPSTGSWSLDVSQCNLSAASDWFQVLNERFEGRDLDGEAIWYSPWINSSAFKAVGFSLLASELGSLEGSDYLLTEFSLDNQVWQQAQIYGSLSDDFDNLEISHFGISADSLRIRIRMRNNASTEYIRFDSIHVFGFNQLTYSNGIWNKYPDEFTDSLSLQLAAGDSIYLNSPADLKNLILDSGSYLDLGPLARLSIHGQISNGAQINIQNGATILQTLQADLNQGNGLVSYQKEYTAVDHRRFSFWSSPMANDSIQEVFAQSLEADRYCFDPINQSYVQCDSGLLAPGLGFAFTPSVQNPITRQNFVDQRNFKGQLNNGTISINFNSVQAGDWLLLGNPYPSPLNFQSFIQANPDLLGTVYFWDSSTPLASGSAYANWNSAGANAVPFSSRNAPNSAVDVAQGFMVQVSHSFSGASLSLQFTNAMRLFSSVPNPPFFKKELENQQFWFSLRNEEIGISTLIRFSSDSAFNSSQALDAPIKPSASGLNLFSLKEKNELSIQSLPWKDAVVVPIGMNIHSSGKFSLSLDSSRSKSPTIVYLYDTKQETYYNLNDSLVSLQFPNTGKNTSRYELHFYDAASLEIRSFQTVNFNLDWRLQNDRLIVMRPQNHPFALEVELLDLKGQVLRSQSMALEEEISFPINDLVQGIYLLQLKSDNSNKATVKIYLP
ncbi:MAG: T9SS type A sorting domain-containing protein [Bacteroidetes bacterium]|nr:T9SS type A sorting domain-containing protein [Bacteroidota bacterium]